MSLQEMVAKLPPEQREQVRKMVIVKSRGRLGIPLDANIEQAIEAMFANPNRRPLPIIPKYRLGVIEPDPLYPNRAFQLPVEKKAPSIVDTF